MTKWHLKAFLHQHFHLQGQFRSVFLLWLKYGIGISKFQSPAGDYGLSLLLVIAGEITLLFPRAGFFSCSIPKIHGPGGAILSPGLAWQDMEKVGT